MISTLSQINFLAVIVAVVASFILGGLWFGVVVAKLYAVALGRESLPAQKPTLLAILGPAFCNFIMIVTSAILLRLINVETWEGALSFGALVGFGYILSTCMTIAINPNFPRPFLYTFINAPYFIISHLMTSIILFLMR